MSTPTPDQAAMWERFRALVRYFTPGGRHTPGVLEADRIKQRALARLVEEAVREETEACAQDALGTGRMVTDGITRFGRYEDGYARAREDIIETIRSRLQQEKPHADTP